jgi:polyhydroxyalkanoate synthase subunit PhaC
MPRLPVPRLPVGPLPGLPGARPPAPEDVIAAAVNLADLVRGRVADLRRMPAALVDAGPQRSLFRYHPLDDAPDERRDEPAVLLVPPLAAPAICFDLRRGCSLAEHLVQAGRRTYLLDYGAINFANRRLGLEHWIDEVIPAAMRAASADAGGRPLHVVGWCLGGIMATLAVAADNDLPVAAVALVASPFDFSKVPLVAPLRPIAALYSMLGGAPAPLVKRGYQLAGLDKYLLKPYTIASNLHRRELLAQIEAVDHFTNRMHAYPGRTFGQLYHRFFRTNDLADGRLALRDRTVCLDEVRVPVLAVAGTGDGIAPVAACHAVGDLLPNAPSVRLETAPGGHLGVLTGRAARSTTWRLVDEFLAGPARTDTLSAA